MMTTTTGLDLTIPADELARLRGRSKVLIEKFYALDPRAGDETNEFLVMIEERIGRPLREAVSNCAVSDQVYNEMEDFSWQYSHAIAGAERLASIYAMAVEGNLPVAQHGLSHDAIEEAWACVRWYRRFAEQDKGDEAAA